MADKANTQIIIRHTAGAKINRIDPFALADTKEITFGREAGSTVMFDSPKDDVVSRKHAILRVKSNEPLSFALEDLKSSNGTFVNGERVSGEIEILPEDVVEFGKGGPKFTFDVQPRPANMSARTRVMSAIEATATRAVATTAAIATPTGQRAAAAMTPAAPPAKAGVGKNTIMMMLSQERSKTSQIWLGAIAAVLAFVIVGGGALYWRMRQDSDAQAKVIAAQQANFQTQQNAVAEKVGMTAGEIAKKYGNGTVYVAMHWRLYDGGTGKAVFHKTVDWEKERLRAYVRLPNGKIVQWFTISDEDKTNLEVGGEGTGSGFVISDQGFILTNKHVAAGWLVRTPPESRYGVLYSYPREGVKTPAPIKFDLARTDDAAKLWTWVPEREGGLIFNPTFPVKLIGANTDAREMQGKNEYLEVRFPGSKLSINASLLRASSEADAALIEIRSPQKLEALEMSQEDTLTPGEKIYVLGYPGISSETRVTFTSTEGSNTRSQREIIPEPTITDGIVSKLGVETTQTGTMVVSNTMGDAFQLSVLATGHGNSGGPVFNSSGKVIGLFTYSKSNNDSERVTFAVPIKHGRALLAPQRTQ